ncbi:hypothetical protein AUC70_11725 [Methyloceanibacter stevinii]|uniref:Phage virion morphogenesis protein n=1 Tax=Methyloceanibacter stevinii TaxID=1774970 RepID=A0A1E3VJ30_9HYPH|nr:phage virion morphogenesis protein [Methyloceanibacter stevinii]ODR93527.1 hypothetical protein AUC70_11725 [Methyloceanibacter stevinii]
MADGFSIRIDGKDATLSALESLLARLEHPKPMFEAMGASLVTSTQRRFELGHDPDGNPWPPSVRAIVEGGKTLVDSGFLVGSITFDASDDHVEVGTNAIQAAVHQLGATIRPKTAQALRFFVGDREIFTQQVTIPARPFLGIDEEDEAELVAIAEEYVELEGGDAR